MTTSMLLRSPVLSSHLDWGRPTLLENIYSFIIFLIGLEFSFPGMTTSSKNTDLYDLDGSSCVFGKLGLLAGVIMSMDEWNVNMFCDCMAWIGMISGHVTHQVLISKWLRQLGRDLRRCVPGNDKPRSWSIFVDPFRT
jgi:predicted acyltransferase